jgi:predicted regulator of Ras-like GTPase activity (Roadblock/LC7/MglB family)
MSLRTTLDQWPSRESIQAAAVVSEDGLLIHDAFDEAVDREAIAALAVTLRRTGRQLGVAANHGPLGSMVVEFEDGCAVLAGLDQDHTLVLLARPDRDLGPLLFDVRRERTALSRSV